MKVLYLIFFLLQCSIGYAQKEVRMMTVLLNNGTAPPPTFSCTTDDYSVIDKLIEDSVYPTRRFLRNTLRYEQEIEQHGNRDLAPIYCRNNCLGFVTSYCRATNCKAYSLEPGEDNILSCPDQITSLNASLNGLMTSTTLTQACRNLLGRPRGYICYNEVVYGNIENVAVYDANRRVLNQPNKVLSICRSVSFKVEVKINPYVDFLYGTAVRQGRSTAYTIYNQEATEDTMIFDSQSMKLTLTSSGNYTIKFIPDNNVTLSKTLFLNWKSC